MPSVRRSIINCFRNSFSLAIENFEVLLSREALERETAKKIQRKSVQYFEDNFKILKLLGFETNLISILNNHKVKDTSNNVKTDHKSNRVPFKSVEISNKENLLKKKIVFTKSDFLKGNTSNTQISSTSKYTGLLDFVSDTESELGESRTMLLELEDF